MNKDRLYLDTSVPSAYFDERNPTRQQITQSFWKRALEEYEVAVSSVTVGEILKTPDEARRQQMLELIEPLHQLELSPQADKLSLDYLAGNLVPPSKIEDARHIAIAVENGFDFLVSWNFSHMVNVRTQRLLPVINAQNAYFKQTYIVTPEAFPERNQP